MNKGDAHKKGSRDQGHAVVVVECHGATQRHSLVIKNSWGPTFADYGYCKVRDHDTLGLEFFDVRNVRYRKHKAPPRALGLLAKQPKVYAQTPSWQQPPPESDDEEPDFYGYQSANDSSDEEVPWLLQPTNFSQYFYRGREPDVDQVTQMLQFINCSDNPFGYQI